MCNVQVRLDLVVDSDGYPHAITLHAIQLIQILYLHCSNYLSTNLSKNIVRAFCYSYRSDHNHNECIGLHTELIRWHFLGAES